LAAILYGNIAGECGNMAGAAMRVVACSSSSAGCAVYLPKMAAAHSAAENRSSF